MPRIEIELTSSRPDGSWTWRAAGARQPKGALDGTLLPESAAVGDRLRAEVEFDVDGNRVTSTQPVKAKREEPARLAIVGSGRDEPSITTNMRGGLTGADDRRTAKRSRDGDRNERRPGGGRADRPGRDDRPRRTEGPERGTRPSRPAGETNTRAPRQDRRPSSRTGGPPRPGGDSRGDGRRSQGGPARDRVGGHGQPPRAAAKRLQPRRVHRDAVLNDLVPELRPVAEKVLRGGIAAVRQALDDQNAAARSAGGAEVKADALLGAAEELVPRLREAEWWDRADAASADVDEISVRDLRSVVAGSDAARSDETRALATSLRAELARRGEAEKEAWIQDLTASLSDGRVVRALRLSGRPPEPGARIPEELAARLTEAASEALSPTAGADRWAAVLDAVTVSPVRRAVRPAGLPTELTEAVTKAATEAASKIPALASLLGLPPAPTRSAGPRPGGRPPPPPRPPRPQEAAARADEQPSGDHSEHAVLVEELGQAVDQG